MLYELKFSDHPKTVPSSAWVLPLTLSLFPGILITPSLWWKAVRFFSEDCISMVRLLEIIIVKDGMPFFKEPDIRENDVLYLKYYQTVNDISYLAPVII